MTKFSHLLSFLKSFLETVHEEDCDDGEHHKNTNNNNSYDNVNRSTDDVKTSKYTLSFGKTNENSQLYEQLNQLKPLSVIGGVKNFKTTKNIILNDSTTNTIPQNESELVSIPATTKTSVVIQTPIQTCSSTSLKRSHQFVSPLISNNNKYTVHFNENSNTSHDHDSITSNDSNDTIIEADISSLSNLDSCNSSKRNSDFFDQQQLNSGLFYFNPENLNLHSSSLNNLTRRNSMPNGSIISNLKRNSLNVTDL